MTPEQQRIAIAEVCGWTEIHIIASNIICGTPKVSHIGAACYIDGKWHNVIPDYLSDLNAMHEAEKVLIGKQQEYYYAELSKLGTWYDCLHATASQRAEAFLRTLNLWKD